MPDANISITEDLILGTLDQWYIEVNWVAACLSCFKCLPGPFASILYLPSDDVEMPSLSGIGTNRPIPVTPILSCPSEEVEMWGCFFGSPHGITWSRGTCLRPWIYYTHNPESCDWLVPCAEIAILSNSVPGKRSAIFCLSPHGSSTILRKLPSSLEQKTILTTHYQVGFCEKIIS